MEVTVLIQEFFGETGNLIPLALIVPAGCLLIVLLLRRTAIRSALGLAAISALALTTSLFLTFLFASVESEMAFGVLSEPLFWVGMIVTMLLATVPLWLFAKFYGRKLMVSRAQ